MSFKGAKKRFQTTNETNYEKKPISNCGRRRDRAGRLCHCAGTSGPRRCGHGHEFGLRGISPSKLDLTADQQTKVQPILDATKPQIAAIHQEAMQKMKTVMDGALSQIRPLLTPEQQTEIRRHPEGASRHDERPRKSFTKQPRNNFGCSERWDRRRPGSVAASFLWQQIRDG